MLVIYIFAALIAGLLIGAFWMPRTYNIEKSIILGCTPAFAMSRVADLHYYSQWNTWQQSDPTVQNQFSGTPATPGHRYDWKGKKVGIGSLTLTSMDEQHIHFDLEFIKPWKSRALDNWLFEPWADAGTKVTWQNNGNLPWPLARLVGPLLNKGLNKQFEQGLTNLKKLCEEETRTSQL